MKEELELELVKKYPDLFRDYNGDAHITCMHWGMAHGDGWYDILDNLCDYLTKLMHRKEFVSYKDEFKKQEGSFSERNGMLIRMPKIYFDQIKEKFAELRIYYNLEPYTDEEILSHEQLVNTSYNDTLDRYHQRITNAIEYAAFLSSKVCEVCGKPGKEYPVGWRKIYCEEHAREYKLIKD